MDRSSLAILFKPDEMTVSLAAESLLGYRQRVDVGRKCLNLYAYRDLTMNELRLTSSIWAKPINILYISAQFLTQLIRECHDY